MMTAFWCLQVNGGHSPGGNPYVVGIDGTAAACVEKFRQTYEHDTAYQARLRQELRGKDLACWCPIGAPCHADIMLAWANA